MAVTRVFVTASRAVVDLVAVALVRDAIRVTERDLALDDTGAVDRSSVDVGGATINRSRPLRRSGRGADEHGNRSEGEERSGKELHAERREKLGR